MGKDYENGYQIAILNDEELAALYSGKELGFSLYENEYLAIEHNGEIVDKFKWQDGKLNKIKYQTIPSIMNGVIKPRNLEQELAIDMLNDRTTPIKVLRGTYGSGRLFCHHLK